MWRPTIQRTVISDGHIVSQTAIEYSWDELRYIRDRQLRNTDWWAMKDRTMYQAQKDYREFLRDLTDNYPTATEAAVAWHGYDTDGLP